MQKTPNWSSCLCSCLLLPIFNESDRHCVKYNLIHIILFTHGLHLLPGPVLLSPLVSSWLQFLSLLSSLILLWPHKLLCWSLKHIDRAVPQSLCICCLFIWNALPSYSHCEKFLKRWKYQTTSWETCRQVQKQQLEVDTEQQPGFKLGKEYVRAVYCLPVYLIYM